MHETTPDRPCARGRLPESNDDSAIHDRSRQEELEKYLAAHPDAKNELQGLFTVVRRDGTKLVGIPYSTYYKDLLDQAATHLREAANISNDGPLKRYLMLRADASNPATIAKANGLDGPDRQHQGRDRPG